MSPAETAPRLKNEGEILEALSRFPALESVRAALKCADVTEAWLVGGLLRDLALGVSPPRVDVDVALPGSGARPAHEVARILGGSAFPLDETAGAWRVAIPGNVTVDLIPLRAEDLEGDLRGRDFTVNAMAVDCLGTPRFLDPLGGRRCLEKSVLVACSSHALTDDPVRVLRAYRFSFGLGLTFEEGLCEQLAVAASGLAAAAPERVRTELFAVLALPKGAAALRAMAEHGVLRSIFPFVEEWRDFDQGDYHAHDLLEHSLRAAEAVERLAEHPESLSLPRPEVLRAHLREELEAGVSRLALLKCAAFLHDVAKPETLSLDGSRRRFLGHEVGGGKRVRRILGELRLGRRAGVAAQTLIAAHLRLFGLAHQSPPTKAARLRYLRDLGGEVPEALLLSLGDELATGPEPPALEAVTLAARGLLALHWEQQEKKQNPPLLRGRDVVSQLGMAEGPGVGEVLRRVGEAEIRGEVTTSAEALALARKIAEESRSRR